MFPFRLAGISKNSPSRSPCSRTIIGSLPGEAVRVLLLSDIHSNLEALEACLAAAPPYDIAVNLGDIVGYGGSPNEVIERSRALGRSFVRGNHDKAAAGLMDLADFNTIPALAALWTREPLSADNLDGLRRLPQRPMDED